METRCRCMVYLHLKCSSTVPSLPTRPSSDPIPTIRLSGCERRPALLFLNRSKRREQRTEKNLEPLISVTSVASCSNPGFSFTEGNEGNKGQQEWKPVADAWCTCISSAPLPYLLYLHVPLPIQSRPFAYLVANGDRPCCF